MILDNLKSILAAFGTAGSLLAGLAFLFVLASAFVSFYGWPLTPTVATTVISVPYVGSHVLPNARVLAVLGAAGGRGGTVGAVGTVGGSRGALGSGVVVAGMGSGHGATSQPGSSSACGTACNGSPVVPPAGVLGSTITKVTAQAGGTITGVTSGVGKTVSSVNKRLGQTVTSTGQTVGGSVTQVGSTIGSVIGCLRPCSTYP